MTPKVHSFVIGVKHFNMREHLQSLRWSWQVTDTEIIHILQQKTNKFV